MKGKRQNGACPSYDETQEFRKWIYCFFFLNPIQPNDCSQSRSAIRSEIDNTKDQPLALYNYYITLPAACQPHLEVFKHFHSKITKITTVSIFTFYYCGRSGGHTLSPKRIINDNTRWPKVGFVIPKAQKARYYVVTSH